MMANSYTTDRGDIEYLGLRFCALCDQKYAKASKPIG